MKLLWQLWSVLSINGLAAAAAAASEAQFPSPENLLASHHHDHHQQQRHLQDETNTTNSTTTPTAPPPPEHLKPLKICNVLGGLDLTRLRSSEARTLFQGAIDDVELIREYFSEAVANGGLRDGLSQLDDLQDTVDWEARNLSDARTTVEAGLGYSDDRPDRRIDRLVSNSTNLPFIGDKQADAIMMDVVSNVMPWIVDRKKNEDLWTQEHINGRSQAPGMEPLVFDTLYMAGYVLSWADSIWYYPPLSVYGHPFQIADVLGGSFDSHGIVVGAGFLPDENPKHLSAFYGPYADIGIPGHALITATTPIYYTGAFTYTSGSTTTTYWYNDTYIAHAGLDISITSVSALLDDYQDTLAEGSFALLTNTTLSPIAISQAVVGKIYPARTGWEEARITYQTSDGSIVDDRRNQTYLVSDTLHQALIDVNVTSANWSALAEEISHVARGDRGYMTLNLTLTNSTDGPVPYYVMFDRWEFVSDWVLLVLVPVEGVDKAIDVAFSETTVEEEVKAGEEVLVSLVLTNRGTLDVTVAPSAWPSWLEFVGDAAGLIGRPQTLPRGASMQIEARLKSEGLEVGTSVSTVSFRVVDDGYSDCFYDRDVSFEATLKVNPLQINNHVIGNTVIAGYFFFCLVAGTALAFIGWTFYHWNHRVVKCSQPRFLVMLGVGTLIMSSSIVAFGIDDDNASEEAADRACMASVWLSSMGFIIAFSALFSKIWRINKIFRNKGFQRITVTEQDVIVPFAVLFTINFALLLAWTLLDPLRFERIKVDENNPFSDTYGTCGFENKGTVGFAVAILIVNFSSILLACWQAYTAREIGDEFSESKWVAITIASWFQVFVVGFPVMVLVQEHPTATYFLKTSIIFVACMSLLLFIFVPKVIIQRRNVVIRGSMLSKSATRKSAFNMSHNASSISMTPSTDFKPPSTTEATSQASSMGFGMKIVRSPAISSAQSEMEDNLRDKVRELEQKILRLEGENIALKARAKDGPATTTQIQQPAMVEPPEAMKDPEEEEARGANAETPAPEQPLPEPFKDEQGPEPVK